MAFALPFPLKRLSRDAIPAQAAELTRARIATAQRTAAGQGA